MLFIRWIDRSYVHVYRICIYAHTCMLVIILYIGLCCDVDRICAVMRNQYIHMLHILHHASHIAIYKHIVRVILPVLYTRTHMCPQ